MNYITYRLTQEEKLKDLAAKFNTTEKDIKALNPRMTIIKLPFRDAVVAFGEMIIIPKAPENTQNISGKNINVISDNYNEQYSYRTEFIVGTKLEGIMVDNSTYKSQYTVKLGSERAYASVVLDENHVSSSPLLVQKGMELIATVDMIKCNSIFLISSTNGKIIRILNYPDIIRNWNKFKADFNKQPSVNNFVKKQDDISAFIQTVESLIIPEENLINDYDTKMFYEIFFTPFLVSKGNFTQSYTRTLYSTIFDKEAVKFNFISTVLEENEEITKVRRVSEMIPDSFNLNNIISLYYQRIKPVVNYNFSEYKYSYRETLIWDKQKNILKESHITVLEEVKNNVQVVIEFNLKMIE